MNEDLIKSEYMHTALSTGYRPYGRMTLHCSSVKSSTTSEMFATTRHADA